MPPQDLSYRCDEEKSIYDAARKWAALDTEEPAERLAWIVGSSDCDPRSKQYLEERLANGRAKLADLVAVLKDSPDV
jgi:hypothetical protein